MIKNRDFVIEDDVLVRYTGNDKNVLIPYGVSVISQKAFLYCTSIENLFLPTTVKIIEEYALDFCPSLKSTMIYKWKSPFL